MQGAKLAETLIAQLKTRPAGEVVAEIRTRLAAEQSSESYAFTAQVLATHLLNHFLADRQMHHTPPSTLAQKKLTPEAQQVTGFATEILIAQGYPNADLLAASLTTLRGFWSEDQIRTQATQAIREAETWLAHKAACTTCSAKNTPGQDDLRQQQIRTGIADLQRLIEN